VEQQNSRLELQIDRVDDAHSETAKNFCMAFRRMQVTTTYVQSLAISMTYIRSAQNNIT